MYEVEYYDNTINASFDDIYTSNYSNERVLLQQKMGNLCVVTDGIDPVYAGWWLSDNGLYVEVGYKSLTNVNIARAFRANPVTGRIVHNTLSSKYGQYYYFFSDFTSTEDVLQNKLTQYSSFQDFIDSKSVSSFSITVTKSSYGEVFADKTEASEGDTVHVTITPNTGYKLYRLFVVGDTVGTVETQEVSANVHTFTMPADNVKVSAIFVTIDPYKPGGDSIPQDTGTGTFDNESDAIPIPDELTLNYSDSGLVRLYNPSRQNLKDFGDFLWSPLIDYDTIKKAFGSPMEQLISLHTIPIGLSSGTAEEVKFGGIGSGVSMPPLTKQFYQVNLGTLSIPRYYGTALDFAPFTRIQLYLPFVGEYDIDADEVMGKDLSVTYQIDALTGGCLAYVSINGNVMYQYSGNTAQYIPLSQSNYTGIVRAATTLAGAAITAAGMVIGGVAGGVAGAAAGKMVSGFSGSGAVSGARQGMELAQGAQSLVDGAGNLANTLTGKPNTRHIGIAQGVPGYMSVPYPYVIIKRPKQSLAPNFATQYGYPANLSLDLSTLSGFCKLASIKPDAFPGTDGELVSLIQQLKAGFYIRNNTAPSYSSPSTGFKIVLEKNASEHNAAGKALTTVAELTGDLLDESNVTNPVITVRGDILSLLNSTNEICIPQFNRRYFITEMTTIRHGVYRLSLVCDVLQTYWDAIKSAPCIIERYENQWTLDLNDPYFQVEQSLLIQTLKFSSSFMMSNASFVLAIAGNGGAII